MFKKSLPSLAEQESQEAVQSSVATASDEPTSPHECCDCVLKLKSEIERLEARNDLPESQNMDVEAKIVELEQSRHF